MKKHLLAITLCFVSISALAAYNFPMASPEIDEAKPFCYYSRPTDQLGVWDAPYAFMVTAEGYLYSRAAELMFMYGPEYEPTHNRNRVFEDDVYPILSYSLEKLGVKYNFKMFAFTKEREVPRSPLYAFVKVDLENTKESENTAYFGVGTRYKGVTRRIDINNSFPFSRGSLYEFRGNASLRDDLIIALYQDDPKRSISATIDNPYNGAFRGYELAVTETAPWCPARYEIDLQPKETKSLTFLFPNVPTSTNETAELEAYLDPAVFDKKLAEVKEDWDKLLNKAVELRIPEEKVQNAFYTSLINMAISRDDQGDGTYYQGVNEMQYYMFVPRDMMYFSWAWYYAGMPDEGRKVVDQYIRQQEDSGRFYNDQENICSYAILMWYQKTKDMDFLKQVWPHLLSNYNYTTNIIANDPLKLMPKMGPYDNEGITGHYTAHNFYNAKAFRYLASAAKDLGLEEESKKFQAYYENFYSNLVSHLNDVVDKYGYITPGLDTGTDGAHWGNMETSYPTFIFGSKDDRVRKTIDHIREYDWSDEGLIMFRALGWDCLHHYNTMKASMADLYLGRDENVIKDLYGVLLHTSSTHALFEFCLNPWQNRDFAHNFTPHGWGHVKYLSLIRSMMVREDEVSNLYLLSATAPTWTLPGKEITAKRFTSLFGNVDLVAKGTEEGVKIEISLDQHGGVWGKPNKVFVKVPYYALNAKAKVDGKDAEIVDGQVEVPLDVKEVELTFDRPEGPYQTYESTVDWYIKEYAKRFAAWRSEHPMDELWECFPEKSLERSVKRQQKNDKLKEKEGLMTFQPVTASSVANNSDAKTINDGVTDPNQGRAWRPAPDVQESSFECELKKPVTAGCVRIYGRGLDKPKVKVFVTNEDDVETQVGDPENPGVPARPDLFVCLFPETMIKKVKVVFEGTGFAVSECQLLSSGDIWQRGGLRGDKKAGNLAYGRPVFTSPHERGYVGTFLVDGETSSEPNYWSGAPPHPQWAIIDLGKPEEISKIKTYLYTHDHRHYGYCCKISPDLSSWKEVVKRDDICSNYCKEGDEGNFEKQKARYVMLVIEKNTVNPGGHAAEIEVY